MIFSILLFNLLVFFCTLCYLFNLPSVFLQFYVDFITFWLFIDNFPSLLYSFNTSNIFLCLIILKFEIFIDLICLCVTLALMVP